MPAARWAKIDAKDGYDANAVALQGRARRVEIARWSLTMHRDAREDYVVRRAQRAGAAVACMRWGNGVQVAVVNPLVDGVELLARR